jgi:predicted nucleotidyltransferase component of viral defense system
LGIELASLKDIAAMKLAAIMDRGTKRDFIDLYFFSEK